MQGIIGRGILSETHSEWIKWTEHISTLKQARSVQNSAFCSVLCLFSGNHFGGRCYLYAYVVSASKLAAISGSVYASDAGRTLVHNRSTTHGTKVGVRVNACEMHNLEGRMQKH